jgi:histone acetyltransferase (RNA polymerase elongator complex component)
LDADGVRRGVEAGLASPRRRPDQRVEIAFFGGTFTGLPDARQAELLETAAEFIGRGRVQGLRLSTRPDGLDRDRAAWLKNHGATTVEIGVQSLDDRVLAESRRGHDAASVTAAAAALRTAGLRVGFQLLLGLPGEDDLSRRRTLDQLTASPPDQVRLYPLLVLQGTELARWHAEGRYRPLELNQTVNIMADMHPVIISAGIRIIRMGLMETPNLADQVIAGPHHPALGHLVRAEIRYRAVRTALAANPPRSGRPARIRVNHRELSDSLGWRKSSLQALRARHQRPDLAFKPDPSTPPGAFFWAGRMHSAPLD